MNTLTDTRWDSAAEGALARMGTAWHWLCEQRRVAPADADVWDIRWQVLHTGPHWLSDLVSRVLAGHYRLSPMQLHGRGEHRKAVWGAQDALVLKWVALTLQQWLPLHPACEHVAGHGGGKASVEKLHRLLTQGAPGDGPKKTDVDGDRAHTPYTWVCRTDIRGYYRHINKQTLLNQVKQHVSSPVLQDLVNQYLHYTVEDGGTFYTPMQSISRGCPLSPLMGALHLHDLDTHFAQQTDIHYARYMDDVIILAKSRWSLRRHTKRLKQGFRERGFEAHPDKTFIGRVERGFDWMGAWLTQAGVTDIAPRAKANHREKVRRLYERVARWPLWKRKGAKQEAHRAASTYRTRWTIWAMALMAIAGATNYAHALTINPNTIGFVGSIPGVKHIATVICISGECTAPNDPIIYGSWSFGGGANCSVPDGRRGWALANGTLCVVPPNGFVINTGIYSCPNGDPGCGQDNPFGFDTTHTYSAADIANGVGATENFVVDEGPGAFSVYGVGFGKQTSGFDVYQSKSTAIGSYPFYLANSATSNKSNFSGTTLVDTINVTEPPTTLACSLDADKTDSTINDPVPSGSKQGALGSPIDMKLTITCGGHVASGGANASFTIQPGTGTSILSPNKLREQTDTQFYATLINLDAGPGADCTGSASNTLKIGGTNNVIYTYPTGDPSNDSHSMHIAWVLCSAGTGSSSVGSHKITAVLSSVVS